MKKSFRLRREIVRNNNTRRIRKTTFDVGYQHGLENQVQKTNGLSRYEYMDGYVQGEAERLNIDEKAKLISHALSMIVNSKNR